MRSAGIEPRLNHGAGARFSRRGIAYSKSLYESVCSGVKYANVQASGRVTGN